MRLDAEAVGQKWKNRDLRQLPSIANIILLTVEVPPELRSGRSRFCELEEWQEGRRESLNSGPIAARFIIESDVGAASAVLGEQPTVRKEGLRATADVE